MQNNHRIQNASRILRLVLIVLFGLLPILTGLYWALLNTLIDTLPTSPVPAYVSLPIPVSTRLFGFLVSLLPLSVTLYGVANLIALFKLYESGKIFTFANVVCFKRLSRVLISWFIVGLAMDPLMSVAMTVHNPPGRHMLTIGVESPDVTALLVGAILAVITWVMEEGRKLQEEQDHLI